MSLSAPWVGYTPSRKCIYQHPGWATHLHVNVSIGALGDVEVNDLRTESCWHLLVHLVAGVHETPGYGHVLLGETIVHP